MIRIVVALACEARPLIARYRLKSAARDHGFQLFGNDDIALIVSGLSRTAAAAATAYLQALRGGREQVWLNVGVAGHRSHALGSIFLARKITDGSRSWYPPPVIESPCATATVCTVDRPVSDYPTDAVYDMEAAGFYPIACRFVSGELVQTLKIISDNLQTPVHQVSAAQVEALLESRLTEIDTVIERTRELADELRKLTAPPPYYEDLRSRWRFSESQRHNLRELLQRHHTLYPAEELDAARPELKTGSDVLRWLEARIAAYSARFET